MSIPPPPHPICTFTPMIIKKGTIKFPLGLILCINPLVYLKRQLFNSSYCFFFQIKSSLVGCCLVASHIHNIDFAIYAIYLLLLPSVCSFIHPSFHPYFHPSIHILTFIHPLIHLCYIHPSFHPQKSFYEDDKL